MSLSAAYYSLVYLIQLKADTYGRCRGVDQKSATAKDQILREKGRARLLSRFRLCSYRHIRVSRNQLVGGRERALMGERKREGGSLERSETKTSASKQSEKALIGMAEAGRESGSSLVCRSQTHTKNELSLQLLFTQWAEGSLQVRLLEDTGRTIFYSRQEVWERARGERVIYQRVKKVSHT